MVCGGGGVDVSVEARMVRVGGFLEWVLHLGKRGLKAGVVVVVLVGYIVGESKWACIVAEIGCKWRRRSCSEGFCGGLETKIDIVRVGSVGLLSEISKN